MQRFMLMAGCLLLTVSCVSDGPAHKSAGDGNDRSPAVSDNPADSAERPAPRPRGIQPSTIKAVWVDAWGPGFYTRSECDRLVQWCLDQGINTLLIEVRRTGDAYYDSDLEPRGNIGESSHSLGNDFDPLAYLVQEARDRHGLRLEAWVVANRVWVGNNAPPPGAPTHVVTAHPDWLLVHKDGKTRTGKKPNWYIDPSNPAARHQLAQVCADVAKRYRVDAVHLDYIRYPDQDWGYGRTSLETFRRDMGTRKYPNARDEKFTAWRAEQVTKQVKEIRAALNRVAPACELTAATVAWGNPPGPDFKTSTPYRGACQDWARWARESLLDKIYVMHYRREADPVHARHFRDWIPAMKAHVPDSSRLIIGLGNYQNTMAHTRRQLRAALAANLGGVAFFSYRTPSKDGSRAAFADILKP